LKYDQALKDLDDIQFQIEKLSTERKDYVNCQQEFDTLFAAKKEQLMKDGGECAHNILEQSKKLNDMKINLKEVKEAISVGSQAVESLERVRDSLNSAEDWGTWDLLGGDVFTDIEKHSHIDDAQSEMENVQTLLRQFHSELTDIHIDSDICIETGGFAKFADFFFDGLIADWNMQSKINQSQANVDNVSDQVSSAVKELELMEDRTTCGIKNLEKEIDRLVVDS
jgi:DNA repair exonuclease SbcCD ATPase subunit